MHFEGQHDMINQVNKIKLKNMRREIEKKTDLNFCKKYDTCNELKYDLNARPNIN